jgi:HAD superfamily hydrolase (TIGR01484 family)
MTEHKGWIALDIDGTITDQSHHVPQETVDYLTLLKSQGWELMFITGRTYSFGTSALNVFPFPFYLGIQNGADILEMPSKKLISRAYLPGQLVPALEQVYQGQNEDFIVYAGYEKGDFCYYRPKKFSTALREHLVKIESLSPEPWKAVDTFEFASHEAFPLIKCLGFQEGMRSVYERLLSVKEIAVSLIRDPLDEAVYLNLVTHALATKGQALQRMVTHTGKRGRVIAAGDDRNDVSMLECADVAIVMAGAPSEMLPLADILAPSAKEQGIITALKQAIDLLLT